MWVLVYDRIMYFARETRNLVPSEASRVMLAVTIEERCAILKDVGARFYKSASDHRGLAFINAWETRVGGGHGSLESGRLIFRNLRFETYQFVQRG